MITEPETLVVFSLAALAILAVPGPAVVYIVTRSIDQGRGAGVASVLGIHVGTLVHLTAATVGLSAILVSSATAFTIVKVLGALYLIVIGIRTLLGRSDPADTDPQRPPRRRRRDFAARTVRRRGDAERRLGAVSVARVCSKDDCGGRGFASPGPRRRLAPTRSRSGA